MRLGRALRILVAITVLAVAGCGGGGGGGGGGSDRPAPPDGPPEKFFHLLEPSPYVMRYVRNQVDNEQLMEVRIDHLDAPLYLGILADHAVLREGPFEIVGVNMFGLFLRPNPAMPPGRYRGDFTFVLCYDVDCKEEHPASGARVPYDVTVMPPLRFSVFVNGTAVRERPVPVREGDQVMVRSNLPIFTFSSLWAAAGLVARNTRTTETTWSATLAAAGNAPAGGRWLRLDAEVDSTIPADGEVEFRLVP